MYLVTECPYWTWDRDVPSTPIVPEAGMDRVTQLYLRKGCTGTECHNYTRSRDIQSTPTEPEAGIYTWVPQLYLRLGCTEYPNCTWGRDGPSNPTVSEKDTGIPVYPTVLEEGMYRVPQLYLTNGYTRIPQLYLRQGFTGYSNCTWGRYIPSTLLYLRKVIQVVSGYPNCTWDRDVPSAPTVPETLRGDGHDLDLGVASDQQVQGLSRGEVTLW